ncbi:YoaK family protein [Streptomyces sp. NPDC006172]|uniref:YoaK family protein n=1 Tax=Streptomyces sp. NPDC006172 TaxID=3154470 RepID=UPI0033C8B51A
MTTEQPRSATDKGPEDRGLRLVVVLLALTGVSGLIDAVSYLGLGHVFTANMTGNVVILGFAAAGAPGFSVHHSATSLACFLLGAVGGGRVARRAGDGSRRAFARWTLAVEAVLLGAASAVAFTAPEGATATTYALIATTAFAMGLRNATVRKLNVPALTTTTVVTMTLTGLAAESHVAGGSGGRTRRRTAAVSALFAGAVTGAWLVLHHGMGVPLLLASLTSAALAVTASGRD